MKKILMIGTGGTIASKPTEDGLVPDVTSDELIDNIPEIRNICEIDCVQVLNLDSTNIRPAHWMILARTIREHYEQYDGFVITHGTDTLAYTASGLSYLIQNSVKPIVITGSQKPLVEEGSDAKRNIVDALIYACDEESCEVSVVFSGVVICGTRARKNYSKRFMAFGSMNFPELARIQDGRLIRYVPQFVKEPIEFYDHLNSEVGLIKLTPGMSNELLQYAIDQYDGLIVESFGVGGLPEYSNYYVQIKSAVEQGKIIVMTTQVPNEGSDLSVYRIGHILKNNLRVLEAYDMTSESVLAKLMWILGMTNDFEQVQKLFYRTVSHDILYG